MKIEDEEKLSTGRRWNRKILAAALLIPLLLALILGCVWTYYFDLNDDALMKQILSGEFTGTPEIRNIQSLFPLTVLLGGLYCVFRGADVYGIFLLILQFGCLGIVIARIGRIVVQGNEDGQRERSKGNDAPGKALLKRRNGGGRYPGMMQFWGLSLTAVLVFLAFSLYHLVFLQYSFTVGMMGATAAFLFLTMRPRNGESVWAWIRELLPPVLLIWLGFLLRSEMMMFMAPFIGLAFLFRLFDLDFRVSEKCRILLLTVVLVCVGLGACWIGDKAGYSSPEWKEFRELFDARTQLYDFERIPAYEGNEDFYDSIGLNSSEVELIQNYNFGIDDRIDAKTLQDIADYAQKKRNTETPPRERLKNALWDLRHSWSNSDNLPYFPAIAVLTVLELALILWNWAKGRTEASKGAGSVSFWKKGVFHLLELLLMLAVSCGMLLYLYYNQRPVVRLTHSIYLAEAVILVWMLARERVSGNCCGSILAGSGGHGDCVWRREGSSDKITPDEKKACAPTKGEKWHGWAVTLGFVCVTALAACVAQVRQIQTEQTERIRKNSAYENEFLPFVAEHPENVYFTDVYSTVDFSDKVFGEKDIPVNWDLMGGWASKSPLEMEKLQKLGCTAALRNDADADGASASTSLIMQESLLHLDNCFIAAEAGEDMQWLVNYYAFRGTEVTMVEADRVGSSADGWVIWKVQKKS